MEYDDPDKLEKLAELLDGFDDESAAEARRIANHLRRSQEELS